MNLEDSFEMNLMPELEEMPEGFEFAADRTPARGTPMPWKLKKNPKDGKRKVRTITAERDFDDFFNSL